MKLYPGRTFLLAKPGHPTKHLWIVLTEPEGKPAQVAMVNLTSYADGRDTTVRLNKGDHPFIHHDSVIHYIDARMAPVDPILTAVAKGVCTFHDDCSDGLLERIQNGALLSPSTPPRIKEYLHARL